MHSSNDTLIGQFVPSPEPFIPKLERSVWTVGVSPWSYMIPECHQSTKPNCYVGIELEILDTLAQLLNVSLTFIFTDVPGCGAYTNNGTWTGLKGMLQTGQIDITGNLCHMDYDHRLWKFSTPSYPVARYKETFLIKEIQQHTYSAEVFGPFKGEVWYSVFSLGVCFVILKTLFDKFTLKQSIFQSLWICLNDITRLSFGMDGPRVTLTWMVWICFVGYVTVLYSSYIKMALMKPTIIQQPFGHNEQFAEKLLSGNYRLLDYRKNPRFKCHTEKACQLMEEVLAKKGFSYFKQPQGVDGAAMTLNQLLLSNETLVFSKGNFVMQMDLDSFSDRHKLWMLDDDLSPQYYMSFLYSKNFRLAPIIDKAIVLLGDFPINRHNMRYGLWRNVLRGTTIKAPVQEFYPVPMWQILPVLKLYLSLNLTATTACVLEYIWLSLISYRRWFSLKNVGKSFWLGFCCTFGRKVTKIVKLQRETIL